MFRTLILLSLCAGTPLLAAADATPTTIDEPRAIAAWTAAHQHPLLDEF